jgi:hypothetical protein
LDFLSLEELKTAFPDRYQKKMSEPAIPPQMAKAPDLAIVFG